MKKVNTENATITIFFLFAVLLPFMTNEYSASNFSYFYITILLSLSLSLIWGLTGIFSFGQAAFFGIGAYTYGILSMAMSRPVLTLVALVAGIIVPTIVAAILGYFMFYGGINDVFVGLITLCVTLALETFMAQTAGAEWKLLGVALGGYNGLNGIAPLNLFGITFTGVKFYILVIIILAAVFFSMKKMSVSRWGYMLLAVRENRSRSELFGSNVKLVQTVVFAVSGALAGLAGILYSMWGGYITPSNMGLTPATLPVVLVAAGGRKNMTAALVFTLLYSMFSQYLSSTGSQYALIILGIVLIVVILFVPDGIIASLFKYIDNGADSLKRKLMRSES